MFRTRFLSLLPIAAMAVALFAAAAVQSPASGAQLATTFSNSGAIAMPASGSDGPAGPYPSIINVDGLFGPVADVSVTLHGFSHTWPDDIDMLLVAPSGEKLVILSAVGGGTDANGLTLTLSDSATDPLPDDAPLSSGSYQPSSYFDGNTFEPPAPAGPHNQPQTVGSATFASAFNGIDPNGTWSLFVFDAGFLDTGVISGGWSLTLTTLLPDTGVGVDTNTDVGVDNFNANGNTNLIDNLNVNTNDNSNENANTQDQANDQGQAIESNPSQSQSGGGASVNIDR